MHKRYMLKWNFSENTASAGASLQVKINIRPIWVPYIDFYKDIPSSRQTVLAWAVPSRFVREVYSGHKNDPHHHCPSTSFGV